jgi:hypothetical protein
MKDGAMHNQNQGLFSQQIPRLESCIGMHVQN